MLSQYINTLFYTLIGNYLKKKISNIKLIFTSHYNFKTNSRIEYICNPVTYMYVYLPRVIYFKQFFPNNCSTCLCIYAFKVLNVFDGFGGTLSLLLIGT